MAFGGRTPAVAFLPVRGSPAQIERRNSLMPTFPDDATDLTRLLVVSDIERSRDWYRDVLGAEIVGEYVRAFAHRTGSTRTAGESRCIRKTVPHAAILLTVRLAHARTTPFGGRRS